MMWTYAMNLDSSGPGTTYLLFDAVRGWHMHNYPYHEEDQPDQPEEEA